MKCFIKDITKEVDPSCCVSQCEERGCKIRLEGMPPRPHRVAIDLNCKALGLKDKKRCDYLFVAHAGTTTCVALIELKSGRVDSATDVAKQLQGGADHLADRLLLPNIAFQFRPVLACRRMHKDIRRQLRSKRVQLRGRSEPIQVIDCGSTLSDVFMQDTG